MPYTHQSCAHDGGVRYIHVKVLERNVVVRIWPLEQSLKDYKVVPRQETALRDVRDAKESSELPAADTRQVALRRDRIDELFTVQEPATEPRSTRVQSRSGKENETSKRERTFRRRRGPLRSYRTSAASALFLIPARAQHF
jgi:hypothetical protein